MVLTPWIVRNDVQIGRPTLATLDPATAIAGTNCDATYYGSKIGSWEPACTTVAGQDTLTELQVTDALQHRGLHYATSHAGRVPLVVAARRRAAVGVLEPHRRSAT